MNAVVIRFAGDSGDGIQVIGSQMAQTSAVFGNDVHTFPDYPAEIRAPAGTLHGVSGFQLCFASEQLYTAGDEFDAIVAFNPAALKTSLDMLKLGGIIVVDSDKFAEKDLLKAGYANDPLQDGSLEDYKVIAVPITNLTLAATADLTDKVVLPEGSFQDRNYNLTITMQKKCKNSFALGLVYWLYERSLITTIAWFEEKFAAKPYVLAANKSALRAGYNYAETAELAANQYNVPPAKLASGEYRQLTGNKAVAFACLAAANSAEVFVSGYPITPASDILHELSKYPNSKVIAWQAEDEIAAACAAVGAAYGGSLAVTCTSGPGFDLKAEALGLAVMAELPLVVVNVQRAGPSTGMPTKLEQSDLLSAIYGRHGESPIPVLAPATPSDCFNIVLEALQIAVTYMTPVIVLSDTSLGLGSEPWRIPEVTELAKIKIKYANKIEITEKQSDQPTEQQGKFHPYQRDPETLARPWVKPGTPELMHCIGGLEKTDISGEINYSPDNHQQMISLRAEKISKVADAYQPLEILGDKDAKVLVISWGSTFGVTRGACLNINNSFADIDDANAKCNLSKKNKNAKVAHVNLRYLYPMHKDLEQIVNSYEHVLVVEYNLGQLSQLIRAKYLIDAQAITKVKGKPFLIRELKQEIGKYL